LIIIILIGSLIILIIVTEIKNCYKGDSAFRGNAINKKEIADLENQLNKLKLEHEILRIDREMIEMSELCGVDIKNLP